LKLDKDYADKKAKLTANELEKEIALRAEYAKKALDLEKKAIADKAAVVQKSQDLLRSAFEAGAKFDLNTLFTDSDQTGAGLLTKMKEKLKAIQKLQQQAGALASAGYSQTFIQEVIAQGPEMGGSMAQAILDSTPETAKELQDLYLQLQNTSKHGLDSLAKQMSTSTSLATEELIAEYKQIDIDLKAALADNTISLNEALAQAQKDLQDSLLDAQNAYNEAIDNLTKDTMDKLSALQDDLKKTADDLAALAGVSAGVSLLASSPAAGYLAGTNTGAFNELPKTTTQTSGVNITTNVTGVNLTDPQTTAAIVNNAVKFGMPQGLSLTKLSRLAVMD
jgi:predicted phage tail protein